jgi:mRNA-degrading endonuclease RelE of RelBE toxin-antitoxin system
MSYTLIYTSRAEKDINKLDSPIKGRLGRSILRLQKNPIQLSEKLTDQKLELTVSGWVTTE